MLEELGELREGPPPHSGRHCDPGPCPLHNPTEHHMQAWPMLHGSAVNLTVRRCPHGLLHPDPDDPRWRATPHACDGCCEPPA